MVERLLVSPLFWIAVTAAGAAVAVAFFLPAKENWKGFELNGERWQRSERWYIIGLLGGCIAVAWVIVGQVATATLLDAPAQHAYWMVLVLVTNGGLFTGAMLVFLVVVLLHLYWFKQ